MATLRHEPLQPPPNALVKKDGIIHESIIDESNTEDQDGTEVNPEDYESAKLNQYDVVFRNKPSQCQPNSAMNEPRSSTATRSHDNINLMSGTCRNERRDKGNIDETALDKDVDVYQEVRPDNQSKPSHVPLNPREANAARQSLILYLWLPKSWASLSRVPKNFYSSQGTKDLLCYLSPQPTLVTE
ncbi:hypothetical protein VDGL01_08324 [Verticillium dahliae]